MSEANRAPRTVRLVSFYVAFVFPACGVAMLGLGLSALLPGAVYEASAIWLILSAVLFGLVAGVVSGIRYLRWSREQKRNNVD